MKKMFYIDKNGNKKKYVGNIIEENGKTYGILTNTIYTNKEVDIKYVNAGKQVINSEISYLYIKNNEKYLVNLNDINVSSDKKTIKFVNKENVELVYHPYQPSNIYYTYKDAKTKETQIFKGEIKFDEKSNTYYGLI